MAKGDLDIAHAIHGGNLAKHLGRRTAKRIIGKQGRKKKPEAQDNTPADVGTLLLVLGGLFLGLFLVTKMALGL